MTLKIFVTGGAGFIGSNTVKLLLDKGYDVTIYDNMSKGHKDLIDNRTNFIHGDLNDIELLNKSIKGHDSVIHFASLICVPESVEKIKDYYDVNVTGSFNLLEAMRINSVKRIIFSSSAAIYGEPSKIPIEEEDLKIPKSPYGTFKLLVEQLLYTFYLSYGINSISLRYFNAYGENELHEPETHAIPNFIKNIMYDKPVDVFGDGNMVRDFIHVEDLAKAHIAALESDIRFGYYNVGSAKGTSVIDVLNIIAELLNKKPNINFHDPRKGDPQKLVACCDKIKRELKWEPKVDLREGLQRTINFFEQISK